MNEKEKEIQKTWNEGIVSEFVRRMLLYYDPLDLIFFAAPDDEYDSYITKVIHLFSEITDQELLEEKIYSLFEKKGGDNENWRRKAHRMAEDSIHFLGQKDKFDFTVQVHPRD